MGTVGSRLREERERRGIGIEEVEAHTKIRARYLLALEHDQFDNLPDPIYARAFVRDYAEELGMDGQALLDEMPDPPPPPELVAVLPEPIESPPRLLPTRWLIAAAALVAVLAGLAWIGAGLGSGGSHAAAAAGSTAAAAGRLTTTPLPPPPGSISSRPPAHPAALPIAFVAAGGPCWLMVRSGSAAGPVLFSGMLETGSTRRFLRRRIWARLGAPWNISLRVDHRRIAVPIDTIGNLMVGRSGARAVA